MAEFWVGGRFFWQVGEVTMEIVEKAVVVGQAEAVSRPVAVQLTTRGLVLIPIQEVVSLDHRARAE